MCSLRVIALSVMCGCVLALAHAADQSTGTPELLQRQGQQKQQLMEGMAATQLSHGQAKRLAASEPQPLVQPGHAVTEAEVQLNRQERIRRLNASKVAPAVTP